MAKHEKVGTAALEKLNISKDEMKEAKEGPTQLRQAQEAEPQSFVVVLINMTDEIIELGCINYNPNGPNRWYPLGPIGRTCSSDVDTCAVQQKWSPVLGTDCTYPPYQLTLATKDGRGATWPITPNCGAPGAWIALS